MIAIEPIARTATANRTPSSLARDRMQSLRGEPLFLADWRWVLMLHFAVDAEQLQRDVPYPLDLHDDRAFVTLVAFTMENLHPRIGGKFGAWLLRPIATHDFLNVRTYVRHRGEPGIHFLAEWLPNRLAVMLGPRTFGLPYRHGRINYEHEWKSGPLRGRVVDPRTRMEFTYRADCDPKVAFVPCEPGSQEEWLMERYAAFNSAGGNNRYFRVWHPPWRRHRVKVTELNLELLKCNWSWFSEANLVSASFSPGWSAVWMGRPQPA